MPIKLITLRTTLGTAAAGWPCVGVPLRSPAMAYYRVYEALLVRHQSFSYLRLHFDDPVTILICRITLRVEWTNSSLSFYGPASGLSQPLIELCIWLDLNTGMARRANCRGWDLSMVSYPG